MVDCWFCPIYPSFLHLPLNAHCGVWLFYNTLTSTIGKRLRRHTRPYKRLTCNNPHDNLLTKQAEAKILILPPKLGTCLLKRLVLILWPRLGHEILVKHNDTPSPNSIRQMMQNLDRPLIQIAIHINKPHGHILRRCQRRHIPRQSILEQPHVKSHILRNALRYFRSGGVRPGGILPPRLRYALEGVETVHAHFGADRGCNDAGGSSVEDAEFADEAGGTGGCQGFLEDGVGSGEEAPDLILLYLH
mmetsp:Transcript_23651/g.38656  ORF Transcript_23651/g.38656 Transcript_23651/m.38656 type:complete len:246 (-) Transcript_23651:923-1660(-)